MSSGDLLFIFSFLILPTIILVSCIWLYILLRKGILLPPARPLPIEEDETEVAADIVLTESIEDVAEPSPDAPAPIIAASTVSTDDEQAATSQEPIELETWQAEQAAAETASEASAANIAATDDARRAIEATPVEAFAGSDEPEDGEPEIAAEATPVERDDTGTEAMPVERDERDEPDELVESNTEAFPIVTAETTPQADDEPGADAINIVTPEAAAEPAAIAAAPVDEPPAGEMAAPVDDLVDVTPSPISDDERHDVYDVIEITDEHPIVEVDPAATMAPDDAPENTHTAHANGVAQPAEPSPARPHAQPHQRPAATTRRKEIRRPVAQLRPTEEEPARTRLKPAMFRKGAGRRG